MGNNPLTPRRSNRPKTAPKYLQEYSNTVIDKGTNALDKPKAII